VGDRGVDPRLARAERIADELERTRARRVQSRPERVPAAPLEVVRRRVGSLSERELEVLSLIADGLSNAEIGRRLHVGRETVKSHARSILVKMPARNRTHAVALAFRTGILH
jgi:ATP/maltotriose-dependent transcriptional regulator MalT